MVKNRKNQWGQICMQLYEKVNSFAMVWFLYLLFGCSTANFGPLSRMQPYSSDVNHLCFTCSTRRSPRASFESLSPAKHLVGFEHGTFRFWLHCLNPEDHSPRRANSVKVNILRNSLEFLHMIFVSFFSQLQHCNISN